MLLCITGKSRKTCAANECFCSQSAEEEIDNMKKTNVVIKHTGEILFVVPRIFKSICELNATWSRSVSVFYSHNIFNHIAFYLECLDFLENTNLLPEICVMNT